MTDELGPDPWEERYQFGTLFLWHLGALGPRELPPALPPLDAAAYLDMIRLGGLLAKYDRTPAASPEFYQDPVFLHGALRTPNKVAGWPTGASR